VARPAYSTNLLSLREFEGTATYTVAAGFVVVVRDIDAFWSFGLTLASLNVVGDLGETFAFWTITPLSTNSQSFQWRGRQVFESGTSFSVITNSALDVRVSGYVLTDS
jgi:hypothetical protein